MGSRVLVVINKFRLRCDSIPVPVNLNAVVISPCFAIFKNVEHSLEPGETPVVVQLRLFFNLLMLSTEH